MSDFSKINYYDLKLEAQNGRLTQLIGRSEEAERLTRVISRDLHNNCLIVGESGSGKTALIHGWSKYILSREGHSELHVVQLDVESFGNIQSPVFSGKYQDALAGLPPCMLILDDFGH